MHGYEFRTILAISLSIMPIVSTSLDMKLFKYLCHMAMYIKGFHNPSQPNRELISVEIMIDVQDFYMSYDFIFSINEVFL